MNCKESRSNVLKVFYTVLNFAFTKAKFSQMLYIKFCAKCNWDIEGFFLKMHNIFYKHISNIINGNNAQKNYFSIEPLLNLLSAFFVEKSRFLSIFSQIQDLGWGYTGEKLKLEAKVFPCTRFWGYLHEKLIF